MKIIGITGGIGCGKSTVCDYLKSKYDAEIILADNVGHEVTEPGTKCNRELQKLFGENCFYSDGTLNRRKIGDIAFKNPLLLQKMNSLIHPAVWDEIIKRFEAARAGGKRLAVLEAALLIESKYVDICDELWYVYADKTSRMKRLLSSRDITKEKVNHIIERQLSEDEFRKNCDFVINNTENFQKTAMEIDSRLAERHLI